MEWTARVVVLALLFELYPRVDKIDDVGSRQQVIDKYAWDSSSHRPRNYTPDPTSCFSADAPLPPTSVSSRDSLLCCFDAS
jgi:hypothetical protein